MRPSPGAAMARAIMSRVALRNAFIKSHLFACFAIWRHLTMRMKLRVAYLGNVNGKLQDY